MSLLPWWAKALILAAIAAAAVFAVHRYNEGLRAEGRAEVRAEVAAAAARQHQANADTAQKAQGEYIERERIRVVTVRETLTEVQNETQNLAACALDAGDVRVLNAAAHRALEDRPAAADPGQPLPAAP
jgi:hypothetical protein